MNNNALLLLLLNTWVIPPIVWLQLLFTWQDAVFSWASNCSGIEYDQVNDKLYISYSLLDCPIFVKDLNTHTLNYTITFPAWTKIEDVILANKSWYWNIIYALDSYNNNTFWYGKVYKINPTTQTIIWSFDVVYWNVWAAWRLSYNVTDQRLYVTSLNTWLVAYDMAAETILLTTLQTMTDSVYFSYDNKIYSLSSTTTNQQLRVSMSNWSSTSLYSMPWTIKRNVWAIDSFWNYLVVLNNSWDWFYILTGGWSFTLKTVTWLVWATKIDFIVDSTNTAVWLVILWNWIITVCDLNWTVIENTTVPWNYEEVYWKLHRTNKEFIIWWYYGIIPYYSEITHRGY